MSAKRSIEERFSEKVEILESGCHKWLGSCDREGYGRINIDGKPELAHRVAWALAGNTLPVWPARVLDHLCRNHWCVNVAHLEDVAHAENRKRGVNGQRRDLSKCKRGIHEWIPANIYTGTDGKHRCHPCILSSKRARY